MVDNYPPGFSPKELDNPTEDIELSEADLSVKCLLTIYCGADEEEVISLTFNDLADLEQNGLRKAESAVKEWQDKELQYKLDRVQEDEEEEY